MYYATTPQIAPWLFEYERVFGCIYSSGFPPVEKCYCNQLKLHKQMDKKSVNANS